MNKSILLTALVAGALAVAGVPLDAVAQISPAVMPASGPLTKQTMSRLLLSDAARVDNRVVAVGDRGYIVYSDNNGASWQRAKTPANTPLLTSVYFLDSKTGWAVGHDSTILTSTDQGATWTKAFSAADDQKPLMDITFVDASRGFAIGAYGAFYETNDGGKTWNSRKLIETVKAAVPPPKAAAKKGSADNIGSGKGGDADLDDKSGGKGGDDDKHLNAIVKLGENRLFIAGEAGMLAKSDDGGKTWTRIASPYKGSFFGAIQAQNGAVVIYGLRGKIFLSADAAFANWKPVENKSVASLMGSTRLADGTLVLAGLSGTLLVSRDNGESFTLLATESTKALSAPLQGAPDVLLLIGEAGVREFPLAAKAAPRAASAVAPVKP